MKGLFVGTLLASLLIGSSAFGEVVVRSYKGIYQFMTKIGGDTDAAALFKTGDTFEVTLTYDTDAPQTFDDGVTARYDGAGTMHVSYSNGYAAGLVNERITVRNNALLISTYTWDSFSMSAFPSYGDPIGAATLVNVDLNLAETQAGTVLSSTDLVPLPDLSLFTNSNQRWVELVFQQPGITNYIRGIITEEQPADPADTFACVGFQSPVLDRIIKVKKNRVIPFKAQITDEAQQYVDTSRITASPVLQVMFGDEPSSAVDVTSDALPTGAGTEGNQFEYVDDAWQFNLSTTRYSGAGTYTVTLQSGDNDEYVVNPACVGRFVIEP